MPHDRSASRSHRPKPLTVFAAAFVAGAAAAVGLNRAVDIHLAQSKPQVECEPIFVALRALPQGSPVTIWDVALRDWPKAMMPTTALRAEARFDGMLLKHPVREGQPILSVQLVQAEQPQPGAEASGQVAEAYVPAVIQPAPLQPEADLWAPSAAPVATTAPESPAHTKTAPANTVATAPAHNEPAVVEKAVEPVAPPAAVDPVIDSAAVATTTDAVAAVAPAIIPDDAVVEDPVTSEPLIAEPSLGDVAITDVPSETTLPAPPAEADIAEPATTLAAPAATKRYLVVPERIAAQADRGFTVPAPKQPQPTAEVQAPAAQAKAPAAQAKAPAVQTQPQAATQPKRPATSARNAASPRKPSGPQPQARPARKQVPRVAEAPTNRTHPTQAEQPRAASPLGSMFPNLRAGLEAFGGGSSAPATPRPTSPNQRSF